MPCDPSTVSFCAIATDLEGHVGVHVRTYDSALVAREMCGKHKVRPH